MTPAVHGAAVSLGIAIAFEAFGNVVETPKPMKRQLFSSSTGALAAAAQRQDRHVARLPPSASLFEGIGNALGEFRKHAPFRRLHPRDVYRPERMTDVLVFHGGPHIEQYRGRILA